MNESKSVHIDFTNKRIQYHPVRINDAQIPYESTVKYLGITLDAELRWKAHLKKKHQQLGVKYKEMRWLLGRESKLSIHNKKLLYNQILRPVSSYGIQLWGCDSESTIQMIQRFQNKTLRNILDAPWYIRNSDIHKDLGIDTVRQTITDKPGTMKKGSIIT